MMDKRSCDEGSSLLGEDSKDTPTGIPSVPQPRWTFPFIIEITVCMYFVANVITVPISQFYVYNQVAKSYGIPNYIRDDQSSICNKNNESESTIQVINSIQKEASNQLMYMSFVSSFTAIIPTFFLGYISDRCGRKVSFLISLLGLLLHQIVYIVVFYFDAPLSYLYIGNALEGISGYMSCAIMTAFIMLADVTSPGKQRGFRIAVMEGVIASSVGLAVLAGGFWIKYSGFLLPMVCSTGLSVVTIFVWIFAVPETRPFREDFSQIVISFDSIKRCFVFYYEKTSQNRRGKMLVLLLILVTAAACFTSKSNVVTLFLLNQPFCWSEVHISVVNALQIIINWVVGIAFLRFIQYWMRDTSLLSFGCFIGTVAHITLGLANVGWMIYLYMGIVTFSVLVVPISRSMLSKLVSPEEQGAMFAGVAAMEHLVTGLAGLLFGEIYKDSLTFYPGMVFLAIAGIVFISLILSGLLCVWMKDWHRREMEIIVEEES
ncbi:lysosomal proton-coupled steroid conjugate and bile acid symporter SLC46A3-like [Argopecten irradians]|uniref:lysosomal proton-coupled steroid conjugate and bile acid symporter SLC46A3-like n=1 Tax=Argopecten irradians TaxID=31199 RepID=UPI003717CCFF